MKRAILALIIPLTLAGQTPGIILGGDGGGGGSGSLTLTTGATDPVGACTNVGANSLTEYYNTTTHKKWTCLNSVWVLDITVNPSATLEIAGNVGTDPCGTVAAGQSCLFFNSANSNHLSRKDDTQTVKDLEAGGGGGGLTLTSSFNNNGIAGSQSGYMALVGLPYFQFAETVQKIFSKISGTASNLCINTINQSQPGDGSMTFALSVNGVDKLPVVVAAGATPTTESCSTGTTAISAGDSLSLHVINASTSNSMAWSTVQVTIQ